MFTCQTECNTLPYPLPVTAWPLPTLHLSTPNPNTLEAAVMIRLGLGREVAITPLKSLWTFLSVGLASSSFGGEGKAQALGLGVGRREENRLVGK